MSLGPRIRIAYHLPGVERKREVHIAGDGSITGGNDARQLGVRVSGDEQVRRVVVCPEVPVRIDVVEATLSMALGDADSLFLNGYNSWTDSIERPVNARMWGLSRVPRAVIDKYVLDGNGDYRFVPEDTRRGHQHGFGYGYVRQGDEVLVFGSLDEDTGMTVIKERLENDEIVFCKEPPARVIEAGERREIISLGVTGGALGDAIAGWLELAHITPRPARPIIGYSSWYRHYGNIDCEKLEQDIQATASVLGNLELGEIDPVFQIDDGFAKVGDWLEYDEERFPQGMAALATEAVEKGLLPGLWLAPFLCEKDSRMFADHQDWLLHDSEGELVCCGGNWSGAYPLDMRLPEVRDHIANVLRTVTQDWGFRLLKLDFLYAACMLPHDGLNRGELMADALDFVRNVVGEDVRLLLCGVPLTSAFGRCEYCRIGPDVGLDWDDMPHRRLLHRERVSTKWSLANARGRAHLDGKVFRCDPDILCLREEGVSFTHEQRMEMIDTDTSCGGVLFTSDNMAAWNASQLAQYHEAVRLFREHNNA